MSNILSSSSTVSVDKCAGSHPGTPVSGSKPRIFPKIWEGEYSPNASFAAAFRHFERSRPLNRLPFGRYSRERRERRLTELNYFGFRKERIGHWIGSVYERPWLSWLKFFRLTNPPEPYRSSGEYLQKKVTSKKPRKWGLSRKKQVLNAAFKVTASHNRAVELKKREEGLTNLPDFSYTLNWKGELMQAYGGRLRVPPTSVDDYIEREKRESNRIKAQDRLLAYRRKTQFAELRRWYLGTSSGITRIGPLSSGNNSLELLKQDMVFLFPERPYDVKLKATISKEIKFEWNLLQRHNTRVMINLWKHRRMQIPNSSDFRPFALVVPPPQEALVQIEDLLRYIRSPLIKWRRKLAKFYRTNLHPDDPLVTVAIPGEEPFIEDPNSGMVEVD